MPVNSRQPNRWEQRQDEMDPLAAEDMRRRWEADDERMGQQRQLFARAMNGYGGDSGAGVDQGRQMIEDDRRHQREDTLAQRQSTNHDQMNARASYNQDIDRQNRERGEMFENNDRERRQHVTDVGNSQQQTLFAKLMEMQDQMQWRLNHQNDGGGESHDTPPPIEYGPPHAADMSAINAATQAAQSAAFGNAKAKAGSLGRSAENSLSSEMAERGISGSGTEGRGIADRLAEATNPLSDLNAAQMGENATNARHAMDLGEQENQTQYQGAIQQRGQDMDFNSAQQAMANQRRSSMMSMFQNAMSGLSARLRPAELRY